MGLTQKPIVNILVGDFNASDLYRAVCLPNQKQIKTQGQEAWDLSLALSSGGLLNTYTQLGPPAPANQEEREELNQSMSCGFTLHICVSRLLELQYPPKMGDFQVWKDA